MRLVFALVVLVACSACRRESEPAPPSAPSAPAQRAPKIEDLPVTDLGKFLGGTSWCRREAEGEVKLAFTVEGAWTRSVAGAAQPVERGSWRIDRGRLVLDVLDGGTRTVDVQTGRVDGEPVVSFDGQLYGACEAG